jgi:hypothetical protein
LLVNEIKEARRLCDDSTIEMDIWYTLDMLIKKSEQAKQMEKEQIEDAHEIGYINGGNHKSVNGEQYYNETYGGTKK